MNCNSDRGADRSRDDGKRCLSIKEVANEFQRRYRETKQLTLTQALSTGFDELDHFTHGFHPGDFFIVAGRPAMGQTPLADAMTLACAKTAGQPVLVVSGDASAERMAMRLLSTQTSLPLTQIAGVAIGNSSAAQLCSALDELAGLPLYLHCSASFSSQDLVESIDDCSTNRPLKLVVITDLSHLRVREFGWKKGRQLGESLHVLKATAREKGVAIVLFSGVHRDVEDRSDHLPRLFDIEHLEILQSVADVIMSLYRDEIYFPDSEQKGVVECHFMVNHKGALGSTAISFKSLHRA